MARPLREGVEALELTAKITLAVLALASGVYTYIGVRDLLDGSATVVFLGAFIYSAAVSVGIYAFWTFLMRLMPHVRHGAQRRALCRRDDARLGDDRRHVGVAERGGARRLGGDRAASVARRRGLCRYARQGACERARRAVAPSRHPARLRALRAARRRRAHVGRADRHDRLRHGGAAPDADVERPSRPRRGDLRVARDGEDALRPGQRAHLAACARSSPRSGPVAQRADAFGEEAVALAGVVTSLQQTSVAPAVRRAADDLAGSFIAPVADGGSEDLRTRQETVVGSVAAAVAAQSKQLADAADQILARRAGARRALRAAVAARRGAPLRRRFPALMGGRDLDRPSAGGAGADPRWRCTARSAATRIREVADNAMTAADMIQAMRLYDRMRREELATERLGEATPAGGAGCAAPPVPATPPAPPCRRLRRRHGGANRRQNVTPLSPQRGRGEAG